MAMTMRERIARAVCEADGYGAEPDPETARDWERHKAIGWPYPCKAGWLRYQDHTDAVLSELETPTEEMKLAMGDEAQEYAIVDSHAPLALYAAAIRAAREGK